MSGPRTLAFLVLLGLGLGCAPPPLGIPLRTESRFAHQWRHFQRLEASKALAVAGDLDGVHVSGFAHAMPSRAQAVATALTHCEARRRDRRIVTPCRIFAIENDVQPPPQGDRP